MSRRYASRRYAGGLGPSRMRTRIPTTRQLGQWVSLRKTLRFRVRLQLSQSRCLSLLLAMSGRVFLFLPPRGHEPPPTLRDRLNPNLSLYRHRFPIPRHAKRPDVALYTIGPFFLLPTPSSTHCALKVSEHDSLWQPPAAHSEECRGKRKSYIFLFSRRAGLETLPFSTPMEGTRLYLSASCSENYKWMQAAWGGREKRVWMDCFLDDLRRFSINADQWTTAAPDKTAEERAGHFITNSIVVKYL